MQKKNCIAPPLMVKWGKTTAGGTPLTKQHKLLIAVGYPAIVIFTVLAILIGGKSYTAYLQNPYQSETVSIVFSEEGIVENTATRFTGDTVAFRFHALKKGSTHVQATIYNEANAREYTGVFFDITVLPTGVLYLNGYDYGGYQFTILGMTLLTLYSFLLSVLSYRRRKKTQFYSYRTVLDLALLLFFGMQSVMYAGLFAGTLLFPTRLDSWQVYNLAGFIMTALFLLSIPMLVLVAAFLSVSNLSLIRHEGFRRNNLFGILISAVLFAGSLLCAYTALKNPNSTGVEMVEIRDAVIRAVVSSAFVYFECILFAAMICTQYAARRIPPRDRDFIIILGCRIGKDGRPLPLLRGRIDRALDFYRQQLEETGKPARFIPSGGKGGDELMSEAESMKNYLLEQGVEEASIFPETKSATTLENMRFSKQIADAQQPDAKLLFSTTNYHVFRSGMLAAKAGLQAEGVGAKTKWYFWPNAQMREFIGLLAGEWKINLLLIAVIIAVCTLFANITTIIHWIIR